MMTPVPTLDHLIDAKGQFNVAILSGQSVLPVLTVCQRGSANIYGLASHEDPVDAVGETLTRLMPAGPIQWAAFTADTYIRVQLATDPPVQHGDMAAAREAGDNTVGDALAVVVITAKGALNMDTQVAQVPYWHEFGNVLWGERTDLFTDGPGSRIIDVIREAVTRSWLGGR